MEGTGFFPVIGDSVLPAIANPLRHGLRGNGVTPQFSPHRIACNGLFGGVDVAVCPTEKYALALFDHARCEPSKFAVVLFDEHFGRQPPLGGHAQFSSTALLAADVPDADFR